LRSQHGFTQKTVVSPAIVRPMWDSTAVQNSSLLAEVSPETGASCMNAWERAVRNYPQADVRVQLCNCSQSGGAVGWEKTGWFGCWIYTNTWLKWRVYLPKSVLGMVSKLYVWQSTCTVSIYCGILGWKVTFTCMVTKFFSQWSMLQSWTEEDERMFINHVKIVHNQIAVPSRNIQYLQTCSRTWSNLSTNLNILQPTLKSIECLFPCNLTVVTV